MVSPLQRGDEVSATHVGADPVRLRTNLGGRIRLWRRRRALSQARLAQIAGVTQSSLSNYENGKRALSVWVLVRIAEELDVSLEELTGHRHRSSARP